MNYIYAKDNKILGDNNIGYAKYFPPPLPTPIPETIAGLNAWFDGQDASSIVEIGGFVSQWTDKSGKNNHAVQGSGANQPQYVTDHLVFDGLNDYMTAGDISIINGDCSIFVVARANGGSTRRVWAYSGGPVDGINVLASSYPGKILIPYYERPLVRDINTEISGQTKIFRLIKNADGSIASFKVNGGNDLNNASTFVVDANTFTLGAYKTVVGTFFSYLNGNIYEVLIYNSVLSSEDISTIETYLTDRWTL